MAPAANAKAETQPAPKPAEAVEPEPQPATPAVTAQPQAAKIEAAIQAGPKRKETGRRVREIHQQPGQDGCIEMYGSCTSGPDRVCTSEMYYLDCGERGQLPLTAEPLRCVCP